MTNNKFKKGFTLIELLVVIAIIALLSSVVMVSLGSARQKARDSYRKETLRQFQSALQIYANEHDNTYPQIGWVPFSSFNSSFSFVPKYLPSNLVDAYEGNSAPGCGIYGFWYGSYDGGKSYKLVACSETSTAGDAFADSNTAGRPFGFSRTSNPEVPTDGCGVTNYDTSSPYYIEFWPACW